MNNQVQFLIAFGLLLLATFLMSLLDSQIQSLFAPWGIVSFEFCGLTQNCQSMLENWSFLQQKWVLFSLGVDYLYMFFYGYCFISALKLLAGAKGLIVLVVLAVLCDMAENYALLQLIQFKTFVFFPPLASALAGIKFMALIVVLSWILWRFLTNKIQQYYASTH